MVLIAFIITDSIKNAIEEIKSHNGPECDWIVIEIAIMAQYVYNEVLEKGENSDYFLLYITIKII